MQPPCFTIPDALRAKALNRSAVQNCGPDYIAILVEPLRGSHNLYEVKHQSYRPRCFTLPDALRAKALNRSVVQNRQDATIFNYRGAVS